jgi:glycosyltransferase involved in cell wall biosynthesis
LRIAVFDYKIIPNNPIGSCHLRLLRQLAEEHEFTVFAVEFQNPAPNRIRWVRVPVPTRPLALLFVAYHVVAPLLYLADRVRRKTPFHLVQMVESNLLFGDVSYSHFCHTAFLKNHWPQTGGSGLRKILRWIDHQLHAWLEKTTFRRVKDILVPSRGLGRELAQQFPFAASKIEVIPNAVDVSLLQEPADFDRIEFRRKLGFEPSDCVFVFAALGQFERKGLPLLLEALAQLKNPEAKLLVVGGEADLIATYQHRVERMNLHAQVVFTGMQTDVKPYLWAADAFAFPSTYETFSLVSYEAAAAGLPVLAPRLNGIEDLIQDGENGILLVRTVEGVRAGIAKFLQLSSAARAAMGEQARRAAQNYDELRFAERWRSFYAQWETAQVKRKFPAPSLAESVREISQER